MADSDEDAPPPLQSLAAQVHALQLKSRPAAAQAQPSGIVDEDGMAVAPTTAVGILQPKVQPAAPPSLKRGFFNAKPTKRPSSNCQRHGSKGQAGGTAKDAIPLIKAKPTSGLDAGPNIPDFLRLEPSEQQKQYQQYKSKLVDALRPTPDMVQAVSSNAEVLAGFDDPEVMAAVSEVARDPNAMRKYANNKKVLAFYAAMGNLMGDKLQAAGSAAPAATTAAPREGTSLQLHA